MDNANYNTYIGARYVPIFKGDWSNIVTYEPLMIVSYQGNSYTSKTYVPTGVPITDNTYWVLTGNYNAQVEAYRQQVVQVQTDMDTLETVTANSIAGFNSTLQGVVGQVGAVQGDVTQLETELGNVNTRVDNTNTVVGANTLDIEELNTNIGLVNTSITNLTEDVQGSNALIETIKNKTNLNPASDVITVGKAGAEFTTINSAIASATDRIAISNRRVTILIYPGTYNEEISLKTNNKIDLQGFGKESTIVSFASTYPNAPIYAMGQITVKDIGFVNTGTVEQNAYAFHYESGGLNLPGIATFERCSFTSSGNSGIGVGFGENCTLILRQCHCISTSNNGAYIHNSAFSNVVNQNLVIDSCYFKGTNSDFWLYNAANASGSTNSKLYITVRNSYGSADDGGFKYQESTSVTRRYIPYNDAFYILSTDSLNNNMLGVTIDKRRIQSEGYITKPTAKGGWSSYYYTRQIERADLYTWTIYQVITGDGTNQTGVSSIGTVGTNYVIVNDPSTTGLGMSTSVTIIGYPK